MPPTAPLDDIICPRTETVHELARILDKERVVHVRGTPCSGKSTLADLLKIHYLRQNTPSVMISEWPKNDDPDHPPPHYRKLLVDSANAAGLRQDSERCKSHDHHYGSPLGHLGVQQRVSITVSAIQDSPSISLFYSRTEFEDVVRRLCARGKERLPLHKGAIDYIYTLTSGHPGAVKAVVGMLEKVYRADIKHKKIKAVETSHIISTLDNEEESFRVFSQKSLERSFVVLKNLTSEAADVLREVLMNQRVARIPRSFPSNLYPDIESLAEAPLRKFSLRNLSSSAQLGTAAMMRPVEAAYQDEMYRALLVVLGFSSEVSSEWSEDGKDVGWGIEMMREGNRLNEHCGRFVENGRHTPWTQLDCRTSPPRPYSVPGTKLWRAVFKSDFTSVETLDSANKQWRWHERHSPTIAWFGSWLASLNGRQESARCLGPTRLCRSGEEVSRGNASIAAG
ncbi:hypothetical protein V8E54_006898 [Elaphomyces granulatus]